MLLAPAAAAAREGFTETESGLQYKIVAEGSGPIPTTGQRIKADYTGGIDSDSGYSYWKRATSGTFGKGNPR